MKHIIKVLSISLLCITNANVLAEKNALMMEMVEDPTAKLKLAMRSVSPAQAKAMVGDMAEAINYRYCIQNISVNKNEFKLMAKEIEEEIEEDIAEGLLDNDNVSITLIDKCPLPANGKCDSGITVEYFYMESAKFLNAQKEFCEYDKENKWTTLDAIKSASKDKKN